MTIVTDKDGRQLWLGFPGGYADKLEYLLTNTLPKNHIESSLNWAGIAISAYKQLRKGKEQQLSLCQKMMRPVYNLLYRNGCWVVRDDLESNIYREVGEYCLDRFEKEKIPFIYGRLLHLVRK